MAAIIVSGTAGRLDARQEIGPDNSKQAYIALALQGDLPEARQVLEQATEHGTKELLERFNKRFVARSDPPARSGDDFIDDVVMAYQSYWSDMLLKQATLQASEKRLNQELQEALTKHEPAVTGESDIHLRVAASIRNRGFHPLQSPASPMRDLVVWRTQRTGNYVIRLSDRTLNARVRFANDFVSLGWKHFATLGLALTTGWVDGNMLFCVEWAYTPNTENFDISFLKHEGRHLADLEQFPELDAVEMEYRAKLTELAFARRSMNDLLNDFNRKSGNNRSSPHASANSRVLNDLQAWLFGADLPLSMDRLITSEAEHINDAARSLLAENTALLSRQRKQDGLP